MANEKESSTWQKVSYFCRKRLNEMMPKVISVCDCEADIFSYLQDKEKYNERFVVRAKYQRILLDSEEYLFEHLKKQSIMG